MSLESELRDALHVQLDTVLDAGHELTGLRVIDNLIADAQTGRVISVSVHSLPTPAETVTQAAQQPDPATISLEKL